MNSPLEVYRQQLAVAVKKATMPLGRLLALGFLAGACIAFGASSSTMASFSIVNPGLAKLVAGVVFPVGLILIVLTGSELFTGNNLMEMALVEKKISFGGFIRNLSLVWLSNLVGSIAVALCVCCSGQWNAGGGALGASVIKIAAAKASLTPCAAVCSGILCNVLVCFAILAASASKRSEGKIWAVWFPIMAFVVAGFEHSVADMYYLPAGLLAASVEKFRAIADLQGVALDNLSVLRSLSTLAFVTIGNMIGAMLFVATIWGYAMRCNANRN